MDILDINAENYCTSALNAIKVQGKPLQDRLEWMANEMLRKKQDKMPYDEFIVSAVRWTREAIVKEGWSLTDANGISWFVSLYAGAYSSIKPGCSFRQIFKDIFKSYYSETRFL